MSLIADRSYSTVANCLDTPIPSKVKRADAPLEGSQFLSRKGPVQTARHGIQISTLIVITEIERPEHVYVPPGHWRHAKGLQRSQTRAPSGHSNSVAFRISEEVSDGARFHCAASAGLPGQPCRNETASPKWSDNHRSGTGVSGHRTVD